MEEFDGSSLLRQAAQLTAARTSRADADAEFEKYRRDKSPEWQSAVAIARRCQSAGSPDLAARYIAAGMTVAQAEQALIVDTWSAALVQHDHRTWPHVSMSVRVSASSLTTAQCGR